MDLTTRYLGLELAHPLMAGASPLVDDLDNVRRLEDAGTSAIVMHSLFEEQIVAEELHVMHATDSHGDSHGEASTYLPMPEAFKLGPEEYLEQCRRIKEAVGVPVLASLNGTTKGGWLRYAGLLAEAGADALELNVYEVPTDPLRSAAEIEDNILDMLVEVKNRVSIPIALKLSPFFTSLPHFAKRCEEAGADGLVLFNRFYQADIDPEELAVERSLRLSDESSLLLRIRWLALLSPLLDLSLACSGGVHTVEGTVKALMAGADAVQVVSSLLRKGPEQLEVLRRGLESWLEAHEYDSLDQCRDSMNLDKSPDPGAFTRANYMHILQTWRCPWGP